MSALTQGRDVGGKSASPGCVKDQKGTQKCAGGDSSTQIALRCLACHLAGRACSRQPGPDETVSLDSWIVPLLTGEAFGDHLAYPEEGGVLVIEGSRIEGLLDELNNVPEDDDQARINKFRELGPSTIPV